VIKSNNHKNLVLSVENNVWATQRHNEERLNEAFSNAPHVVLLFSVNMSGCFQGYAKMVSPVGSSKKTSVFQGFGRAFDVRWLRLDDLDFNEVAGISNPLNENKSVKVSRDGQELPFDVGRRVCEMVDHRVYRADPSNYITDEKEVETGGFGPPLLSHRPAEALQPSMRPLAEPMPAHPLAQPPPSAYGAPGAMPPGAVPPQPGAPPGMPLGPEGYAHGPGALAWNPWAYHSGWPPYQHFGPSSESSYSSSSYSSYSYSDSEEEDEARPPPAAAQLPASLPVAPQPVAAAGATSVASTGAFGTQLSREHTTAKAQTQPWPLPAVAQPAPLSTAAAPAAQPARERTRGKDEKVAKEAKKAKQAKEAKTTKEGKASAKQAKESKERKTLKEGKAEKAPKGKEKKMDHKEKCRTEKKETKKSWREAVEGDGHARRSSRVEAADGRKEKRQRVVLKQDAADGHKEKRRKVVLKQAKDVEREGRHREKERTSRDRRRRGDRHSDPATQQEPPRGPSPQQQPGAPAAVLGAPPPDEWRGAPPIGHPPSHWPPLPGYAAPPLHSHHGLPPPRPLPPPMAGAPDWRSHAAPRGAPPLDWHGACPVRS